MCILVWRVGIESDEDEARSWQQLDLKLLTKACRSNFFARYMYGVLEADEFGETGMGSWSEGVHQWQHKGALCRPNCA